MFIWYYSVDFKDYASDTSVCKPKSIVKKSVDCELWTKLLAVVRMRTMFAFKMFFNE